MKNPGVVVSALSLAIFAVVGTTAGWSWGVASGLALVAGALSRSLWRSQSGTGAVRGEPLRPTVERSGPVRLPGAVRFDAHLFFAEIKGVQLVLDGLAETIEPRGAVLGVPFSLVLARPPSLLGEALLFGLLDEAGEDQCQVELDLVSGQAWVRLLPPGGVVSIPAESVCGLPSAR